MNALGILELLTGGLATVYADPPPGGAEMKGATIVLQPSGSRLATPFAEPPPLEHVKAALGGGFLEVVPHFDSFYFGGELHRAVAFCDEHGKNKGLPLNSAATVAWRVSCERVGIVIEDILAGPVLVIIGDDEFMAEL